MDLGKLSANRSGRSSLKTLKYKNRHSVLNYLRKHAYGSVAEIASRTSLSKMTVHNIMEHFLSTGLVTEAGKGDSTDEGGKKPKLFAFNPDVRCIFTACVTRRSLMTALANMDGEISVSHTALYGPGAGLDEVLAMLHDSFEALMRRRRIQTDGCLGAVVGLPGIIDVDRGTSVFSPHFRSWGVNVPLRDLIAERLPPGIPVFVDNRMRYHAYGELRARDDGTECFFLFGTEDDGVVGGLVVDGRLRHGGSCLAGEIGHMVVDPSDETACACGGAGCLESMVSPWRMERGAKALRGKYPDSMLFAGEGDPGFDLILAASNHGDAVACGLVDGAAQYFAIAINNLTLTCDPGLFIIQGVYSRAGDYFLGRLRERAAAFSLLRMNRPVRIEYSAFDDDFSLTGGACYLADLYFESMGAFD